MKSGRVVKMKLIFISLTISVILVYGDDDDCVTPTGEQGKCVIIKNCEKLKNLIKGTAEDRESIKEFHCGFAEDIPKVCCEDLSTRRKITTEAAITTPDSTTTSEFSTIPSVFSSATAANEPLDNICYTLEATLGICVDIKDCPALALKLNRMPVKAEDLEYVQRSRCVGPVHYSVCCEKALSNNVIESRIKPIQVTTVKTEANVHECNPSVNLPEPTSSCCGIDMTNGEEKTAIRQYPWLAIIEYEEPKKYQCGGSLISSMYVLTAAHCVVAVKNTFYRGAKSVRLGEYNITNDGKDCVGIENDLECTDGAISIAIARKIVHPDYNREKVVLYSNDIALLKLSELAPYNDFIRPICLPTSDITQSPPRDLRFFVAGWGATDEFRNVNDIRLDTDIPFVNNMYCRDMFKFTEGVSLVWEKQICAGGEPNKDSCKGDAGGPLMTVKDKKFEITGIISYGLLMCTKYDKPSVYTKVYDYLPWIKSTIEE